MSEPEASYVTFTIVYCCEEDVGRTIRSNAASKVVVGERKSNRFLAQISSVFLSQARKRVSRVATDHTHLLVHSDRKQLDLQISRPTFFLDDGIGND